MTRQIGPQGNALVSKYLVGPNANSGYFTTIQSAVNQAVSDGANASNPATVYIAPGTYTENLTLHGYVHLAGIVDGSSQAVLIEGNAVYSDAGIFSATNVCFETSNSSAAISIQGAASATIHLDSVSLIGNSGIAFECTGSGKEVNITSSTLTAGTGGRCKNVTNGTVEFFSSTSVYTDTPSTISGGTYISISSDIKDSMAVTNGAISSVFSSTINSGSLPCMTIDGSSFGVAANAILNSNSGTGYYITGTGNVVFSNNSVAGSANSADPSLTLVGYPTITGNISFDGGATKVSNDGELIIGDSTGYPKISTLSSSDSSLTITNGHGTIDLKLSAPISVSNGGTGRTSVSTHNLLSGNGTSSLNLIDPTASVVGNPLVSNGAGSDASFSTSATVNQITINNSPSSPSDGTPKSYVDLIAAGFSFKNPCYAASTGNFTATYNNGVGGTGATLTNADTQTVFTIDGQTPGVGERVLIKDQNSTLENGIYEVTDVGSGSTNWILTRTTDYDAPVEIQPGTITAILNGTVNAATFWVEADIVTTVGSDPIEFIQFGFSPSDFLLKANNLSDLNSASTSRSNLGLTNIATQTVTQYNTLVGGSSNAITSISPGSAGDIYISGGGSANPSFVTPTAGAGLILTSNASTLEYALDAPVTVSNGGTGSTSFNTNGIVLSGASGGAALTSQQLTNGQLLIGRSGNSPLATTLTAGSNITITNGSGSISIAAGGGGPVNYTSINNAASPYTVTGSDYFISCQTSTGDITVELPDLPATGSVFVIKDADGNASTNNISLTSAGGLVNIDGVSLYFLNVNYQALNVIFNGSNYEVF